MTWQKRARLGIAVFGLTVAGLVFFAVGERERPVAAPVPTRLDPKAIMETSGCVLQRVTGTRKDFTVTCDRQLAYANHEVKLLGVRIEVKERQGRDFLITGAEALANEKSREIHLSGEVQLSANDGFQLRTATATFDEDEGVVRAPGPISFTKGSMSGTGVGMTYDKNTDVLTIAEQAHVQMVDQAGAVTGEFTAGSATFARQQDYLALDRRVHALRGEQTIDAERGTAHLTVNDDAVTLIELRGSARVAGGSAAFDSMSARDIDLDYADDGTTIERVVLAGAGSIALRARDGSPGHQIGGDSLTIALAPDGAVTSAIGRGGVRLDVPASAPAPSRRVTARTLDAAGEAGKGMTTARFTDNVEYREDAARQAQAARVARANALDTTLDGRAITGAVFTGGAQFEEGALKASAAEARYEPAAGALRLRGTDDRGGPRVADERVAIEAAAIDVALEGRRMKADGNVRTRLQSGPKTPGLLDKERPANITAAGLQYDGASGRAVFSGTAQLLQGDTAIRGDVVTVDQEKGNLMATGNARSALVLGGAPSIGTAQEIAYDNASRQVTFQGFVPPPPAKPPSPPRTRSRAPVAPPAALPAPAAPTLPGAPPAVPARPARLSGPEGDLTANRIAVVLHASENRMERLEGYENITLRVNQRLVTGVRMTYFAEGKYVMTGAPTQPVKIVENCRETTGRTLTFFKSTDNIIIDGNEEIRTRTTSGGPCPQPLQ